MVSQTFIISGKLKGRKICFPQHLQVRPTKSIVRAALFNILGDYVVGSSMIDFFAGTGSVGWEALSRGAKKVAFFEKNYECYQNLQKTMMNFSLEESVTSFCNDTLSALKNNIKMEQKYDWAYLDPPYDYAFSKEIAQCCLEKNLLVKGGLIVCERPSKEESWQSVGNFSLWKSRAYGRAKLDFYKMEV